MDRELQLVQMVRRMQSAYGAKHWHALARINGELAGALMRMGAKGKWSPRELKALSALRDIHQLAYEGCCRESEITGRRIDEMQRFKDGWMAYAMSDESPGERG